jgi:hypothetical protein
VNAYKADDSGKSAVILLARMTREEWIAFHVARAPKITPKQWAETLILLRTQENDNDEGQQQEKAD